MSNTIIQVENLGKKYLIKHQQQRSYTALRDVITDKMKSFGKKIISPRNHKQTSIHSKTEEFWALKDVSFKVKQGEVIGIIGRNGAGKSTLLKIISRITEPTKGRIRINGRVASLLEVGTGFHPELTGRENIFLNGAILGMGKTEIKRKFDEIVSFAEIERFLDTPVKRYSSGMYVRLAFAVAAHLEPEILVVDEVLAVGDAQFQKKCLGKMEDVGREGRTVLFVSHNMWAVQKLCKKTLLINNGRIVVEDLTRTVINKYLIDRDEEINQPLSERTVRTGGGNIIFKEVSFEGTHCYEIGDDISICLKIENLYQREVNVRLSLSIRTINETPLISCDSDLLGEQIPLKARGDNIVNCKIYSPPLNYGEYYVNLAVYFNNEPEDWITSAAKFSIAAGMYENFLKVNDFPILSKFKWIIKE